MRMQLIFGIAIVVIVFSIGAIAAAESIRQVPRQEFGMMGGNSMTEIMRQHHSSNFTGMKQMMKLMHPRLTEEQVDEVHEQCEKMMGLEDED